ncbi:MAG: hypothetical protein ACLFP1_06945 [Candidatus Goldiibacteriota bacterium]
MKKETMGGNTEISSEERELLMLNDKPGRKAAENFNKETNNDTGTLKIDNALKRLYMTLILRSF